MKGTASKGKKSTGKSHIMCRRCGKHAYNPHRKKCASCGYGLTAKRRSYSWQNS